MRFLNMQKIKTDTHLIINNTFCIKKILTIDYLKMTISSSSGMSCKSLDSKVPTEFSFT